MIEVRKYQPKDKNNWDKFLNYSKNSSFLFNRDFMDYHKDRFEDYSLIISEDGVHIASFAAHKHDETTIASHFGLTHGGIIVRRTEKLFKIILIIYHILYFLHRNNIKKILYKSFPKYYNLIGSDEIAYAKFLIEAKLINRQISSVINLSDKLDFSKTRIRYVKKAKKNHIVIKEVNTFDSFWNEILIPNLKNKYDAKPVHTLQEITKLHQFFPNNIRQFNAYLNGEILAGATIFEMSHVARVQYNSSNLKDSNNGASDLLYNELIEVYFKHKNYFDFGTSCAGSVINVDLLNWKESYGARAFALDTYEIETYKYHLLKKEIYCSNIESGKV